MNGVAAGRRSARPVRVALARDLGADIDGAWWPHTGSVAGELPGLIAALHPALGEIFDISVNWSETDAVPDLNTMRNGARSLPGCGDAHQRVMVIAGRRRRVKLLVIPHRTPPALGLMVLRRAAALPVPDGRQVSDVLETAERVVRAAQAESARWTDGVCAPHACADTGA